MPSLNPPLPAVGRVAVLNAVARSLPSLVACLHGTGVPVELCDGETDAEVLIVGGLDFGAAQFDAPRYLSGDPVGRGYGRRARHGLLPLLHE